MALLMRRVLGGLRVESTMKQRRSALSCEVSDNPCALSLFFPDIASSPLRSLPLFLVFRQLLLQLQPRLLAKLLLPLLISLFLWCSELRTQSTPALDLHLFLRSLVLLQLLFRALDPALEADLKHVSSFVPPLEPVVVLVEVDGPAQPFFPPWCVRVFVGAIPFVDGHEALPAFKCEVRLVFGPVPDADMVHDAAGAVRVAQLVRLLVAVNPVQHWRVVADGGNQSPLRRTPVFIRVCNVKARKCMQRLLPLPIYPIRPHGLVVGVPRHDPDFIVAHDEDAIVDFFFRDGIGVVAGYEAVEFPHARLVGGLFVLLLLVLDTLRDARDDGDGDNAAAEEDTERKRHFGVCDGRARYKIQGGGIVGGRKAVVWCASIDGGMRNRVAS